MIRNRWLPPLIINHHDPPWLTILPPTFRIRKSARWSLVNPQPHQPHQRTSVTLGMKFGVQPGLSPAGNQFIHGKIGGGLLGRLLFMDLVTKSIYQLVYWSLLLDMGPPIKVRHGDGADDLTTPMFDNRTRQSIPPTTANNETERTGIFPKTSSKIGA